MKKKILKGIIVLSLIIACITPAFAGTKVDLGGVKPGSMDTAYKGIENEVKQGNITEEFLYQLMLTEGFSPNIVAKILDDGYATQYADSLKAAGRLPVDYKTNGSTTVITNNDLQIYSAVFDANYYLTTYPELKTSVGKDPVALLKHFINIGMNECRQGNTEFNVFAYAGNNPDLMAAYGIDAKQYYIHYITCGKTEGRIAK